jgi:hypothetical protein
MTPHVPERMVCSDPMEGKRLGRIERQLLLEAAPVRSKPLTAILPPFGVPRQASNRAVRSLRASDLLYVAGQPVRWERAELRRVVHAVVLQGSSPRWLPNDPGHARVLHAMLTPAAWRGVTTLARRAGFREYLDLVETEWGIKDVYRPYLLLRFMSRTELGEAVVAKYRSELESALTPGPLDRIRWGDLAVREPED